MLIRPYYRKLLALSCMPQYSLSSKSKEELQEMKESAYMAASVIKYVSNPKGQVFFGFDEIRYSCGASNCSFNDEIVNTIIENNKGELNEGSVNKLKYFFDPQGGFKVENKQLQDRFAQGFNKNSFFPVFLTRKVAVPIFYITTTFPELHRNNQRILFGNKGIGKSSTLFVYSYLSSLVTNYIL